MYIHLPTPCCAFHQATCKSDGEHCEFADAFNCSIENDGGRSRPIEKECAGLINPQMRSLPMYQDGGEAMEGRMESICVRNEHE